MQWGWYVYVSFVFTGPDDPLEPDTCHLVGSGEILIDKPVIFIIMHLNLYTKAVIVDTKNIHDICLSISRFYELQNT